MDEPESPSDPDGGEEDGPATGERSDHHNAPPGVEVPGGPGTDPAGEVPGKPDDEDEPGEGREDGGLSPI